MARGSASSETQQQPVADCPRRTSGHGQGRSPGTSPGWNIICQSNPAAPELLPGSRWRQQDIRLFHRSGCKHTLTNISVTMSVQTDPNKVPQNDPNARAGFTFDPYAAPCQQGNIISFIPFSYRDNHIYQDGFDVGFRAMSPADIQRCPPFWMDKQYVWEAGQDAGLKAAGSRMPTKPGLQHNPRYCSRWIPARGIASTPGAVRNIS